MRAQPPPITDAASRPTTFVVGAHAVVVAQAAPLGRWTLKVDGVATDSTFESEVDAWTEGVRLADLKDRGAPAGR